MRSTVKKMLSVMMIFSLLFVTGAVLSEHLNLSVSAADTAGTFEYVHDPRLNPSAMEDITEDKTAVYGFRPNDRGSLKQYASYNWTDPVSVEEWRRERIEYHVSIESIYELLYKMIAENKSTKEIACAVSQRRNEIRIESYADNPEGLAVMKERNLERFGHEEGPLPDELYEKYGSWEMVIEKAFSPNAGMDAWPRSL